MFGTYTMVVFAPADPPVSLTSAGLPFLPAPPDPGGERYPNDWGE